MGEALETVRVVDEPVREVGLSVVVIGPLGMSSRALPESGVLGIGRAAENALMIDDPQISRAHARLHVGEALAIEDLGSANGTRLGGAPLEPHRKTELAPGQLVELGTSLLLVQRGTRAAVKRRLVSHTHLEVRLEEECARNQGGVRATFALVRLRISGAVREDVLERELTAPLRVGDVLAGYARGHYELLLLDTARPQAESVVKRIQAELALHGAVVAHGLATCPEDGLQPEVLIGRASEALAGTHARSGNSGPVIADPAMRDLYRVVDRIAKGNISVLLQGETGVGKEVVAEAIHQRSPRAKAPYVRLNCAALSETLVESELFGHERGAFTGADRDKKGLIESADGGTVFLDEVGELSASTQAKLLRVLEQREVMRVGRLTPVAVDVRFIAATNRDLVDEVARGRFRQDLYYRLGGVTLRVPPLRERKGEIELLAELFLERASLDLARPAPVLSEAARALLLQYPWPGNIRELKNAMERAALLAPDDVVDVAHLPFEKMSATWTVAPRPLTAEPAARSAASAGEPMSAEEARIRAALDECAGNQTRAAERLGVSRQTLSKWLDRYDIRRPRK